MWKGQRNSIEDLGSLIVAFCLTLLLCLGELPAGAQGCSPIQDDVEWTVTEHVHHAHSVFWGKVLNTYTDDRFNYGGGSQTYSAEMDVYCIMKGPVLDMKVNVSEAGIVPGHCSEVKLEVGKEYIIIGYQFDMRLTHSDTGSIRATRRNLQQASKACGLTMQYPRGSTRTSRRENQCPTASSAETCVTDAHEQEGDPELAEGIREPDEYAEVEYGMKEEKPLENNGDSTEFPEANPVVGGTGNRLSHDSIVPIITLALYIILAAFILH